MTPTNRLPGYSCLMSVYGGDALEQFELAIDSMLGQTHAPSEIVLVVDGPVDRSIVVSLDRYIEQSAVPIKAIVLEENRGLWHALRLGVLECKFEWIARMDADDYSRPDRMATQLKHVLENPALGCVGSLVEEFVTHPEDPVSLVRLPASHEEIAAFGKRRNPLRHPTMVFKRSVVLEAGNYREFPYFEDYDLYVRMLGTGCRFANVQSPLVSVRTSADFFRRRGGYAYLRHMLRFRFSMLRAGYVGPIRFVAITAQHLIVTILPNRVRLGIYRAALREEPTPRGAL